MINTQALDRVRWQLERGMPLTLTMLGQVFGEEFWQLIVVLQLNERPKIALEEFNSHIPALTDTATEMYNKFRWLYFAMFGISI